MRIGDFDLTIEHQAHEFIRSKLKFDADIANQIRHINANDFYLEHKRFDMSGYDYGNTGCCTLHNTAILNLFADIGIYDYTNYLFVDFYKGAGVVYFKYFGEEDNLDIGDDGSLGGIGTVEIIYEILKITVMSGRSKRRRR